MAEQQQQQQPAPLPGVRNWVSRDSEKFKPESGSYHLYLGYICPYAQRAHIALNMKGLQNHISISLSHPTMQKTKPGVDDHLGWVFKNSSDEPIPNALGKGSFSCEGCIPDPINNAKTVRELYDISGNKVERYTIPVLWDIKQNVIVNNESAEILRMLNSEFNEFFFLFLFLPHSGHTFMYLYIHTQTLYGNGNLFKEFSEYPNIDLYPEGLRQFIDETNEWVQQGINTSIYRAGFAKNQEEYLHEINQLFTCLDKIDNILNSSRYLCGNVFTEADIKLFVTLLRFDEAAYVLYKTNKKLIRDYQNLQDYLRDIYQIPGVSDTVNLKHIKDGAYSSAVALNPSALVPVGSDLISDLLKPHNRNRFNP